MEVKVNNKTMTIPEGAKIEALLRLRGVSNWVLVIINGVSILQHDYPDTCIKENDDIRIIVPLAGG